MKDNKIKKSIVEINNKIRKEEEEVKIFFSNHFYKIIIVLALILFFTNPTEQNHLDAITAQANKEAPILGSPVIWLAQKAGAFKYNNFYLFSLIQVQDQEKHPISLGLLNYVFVIGSDGVNTRH